MTPVVRVSILRCPPERYAELLKMMKEDEAVLRPGIEAMPGLITYFSGADEATNSFTNVSVWTSLEGAKQLETYQPMLDLAKPYMAKGAVFERPIMNYTTLWQAEGRDAAKR